MAEEAQAPEVAQDTPIESAPAEDTQTPTVDYRQRYDNLRPEYDRTKQQLKEYEERLAAYEAQLQEPDDEEDYEFDYEDSVARQKLAELEARLAERDQQETQEREWAETSSYIDDQLDSIESEFEDELSDSEASWIGNFALANRDENGKPDVRRAYEAFNDMLEGRKQKWVKTKKAPKVNSGPAAAQSIDLDDPKTRREYMAQKLAELESPE